MLHSKYKSILHSTTSITIHCIQLISSSKEHLFLQINIFTHNHFHWHFWYLLQKKNHLSSNGFQKYLLLYTPYQIYHHSMAKIFIFIQTYLGLKYEFI
jgi:hypothetical protein